MKLFIAEGFVKIISVSVKKFILPPGGGNMYRTVKYEISENHEMYGYCRLVCSRFKNMYNVSNYYIRNVMTGIKKPVQELTSNEKEVLDTVKHYLELNNASMNRKSKQPKKQLKLPTVGKWFLGYEQLNAIFSLSDNVDYRNLQSHMTQKAIRKCVDAWKGFFAANKGYRSHPEKFKGKCKIPGYLKKEMETVHLSNLSFSVKRDDKGRYVDFAKVDGQDEKGKVKFYIGDYINTDKFEKIEIKPYHDSFALLVTYVDENIQEIPEDEPVEFHKGLKVMGIDLGVKNFATITDNLGNEPVIIKGGFLKSRNQYFNKYKAVITSNLQAEKLPSMQKLCRKKLHVLSINRDRFFRDCFYKIAHKICRLAKERGITKIVVGHSDFWKTKVNIGCKNNQNFVGIPFNQFIHTLRMTAYKYGIQVIENEESYTSKASFLDNDDIPVYSKYHKGKHSFSGRRMKRGMYKSKDGILMNADVNASLNIIKKAFGDMAFHDVDRNAYLQSITTWGYYDFYPAKKKILV